MKEEGLALLSISGRLDKTGKKKNTNCLSQNKMACILNHTLQDVRILKLL